MDPVAFIGSLIAILALAGLALWLKLGATPHLANEDDARRAADEAVDGFETTRLGLDRNGAGGILEDAEGRLLLLKPHGNFFAGRLLGPNTSVLRNGDRLTIHCGERTYGVVTLELEDAHYWADAIDRLKTSGDA